MHPELPGLLLGALSNLVQPEQNTKLYRSYCQPGPSAAVTRHRGKSPRQAAFFFRNPQVTFHAAQLASLFLIYGLVGAAGGGLETRYRVGSLESGTLPCQAYEAYLELHTPASTSFEHAWFFVAGAGETQTDLWQLPAAVASADALRLYAAEQGVCWMVLRWFSPTPSPRQAAFFFKNPDVIFHAAQLASLYVMFSLVCGTNLGLEPRFRIGSLESGALLCQAYEAYLELHSPADISFEHAWFLLLALARRDEVAISRCGVCGGVRLRDLLAKHKLACGTCDGAVGRAALGDGDEKPDVEAARRRTAARKIEALRLGSA